MTEPLAPASSPLGPPSTGEPWFRRIVLYSLLSAPCPLIPVPLLDDWVLDQVRKRLVGEIARGSYTVTERDVTILAGLESARSGCFLGVAVRGTIKFVFKVIGGIFRKILFFLTIKQCVTAASQTFHEGYLLHRALAGPSAGLSSHWIRWAVDTTMLEVDPKHLRTVMKGVLRTGWSTIVRAGRLLGGTFRRRAVREEGEAAVPVEEGERLLGGLVDQMTVALGQDRVSLARLDAALFRALQAARLDPPGRSEETSGR